MVLGIGFDRMERRCDVFFGLWLGNKGRALRDLCRFRIHFREMKWAIQLFIYRDQ